MVLVIDNYDSFTYNLVQYLGELGAEVQVMRNDMVTLEDVVGAKPERIVISPGPGRPEHAGVTMSVIRQLRADDADSRRLPRAPGDRRGLRRRRSCARGVPMHGKTSTIDHDGRGVFSGIAGPFVASRYHSLVVAEEGLPAELEVTARTQEDAPDHGAAPPRVAGPRRPVSSRVDSDRRGQDDPPEFLEDRQ